MLEYTRVQITICLILSGKAMVVPVVMDVVLKLGCHGFTGSYLYQ